MADVHGERSSGIENEQVAQKTARMPAHRPGVVASRNLILQHPGKIHRSVEIEGIRKPAAAAAQLRQKFAPVRIVNAPAIPPGGPAPAVGAADEERLAHRPIERIAVTRNASDAGLAAVARQCRVHETEKIGTGDDVVLYDDDGVMAREHGGNAARDVAGEAEIAVPLDDLDRLEAGNSLQKSAHFRHAARGRPIVAGRIGKSEQFGRTRFGIGAQRLDRAREVARTAVGEQRDGCRHGLAGSGFPEEPPHGGDHPRLAFGHHARIERQGEDFAAYRFGHGERRRDSTFTGESRLNVDRIGIMNGG